MNDRKVLKIGYTFLGFVGFLFVLFCKTGYDLAKAGNILWTGNYVLGLLALSLPVGAALGAVFGFLFYGFAEGKWHKRLADSRNASEAGEKTAVIERFMALSDKKVFALAFVLILLSYLPAYLAFYPGICAYDVTIQIGQLVDNALNDHHPIVHTLLLKAFLFLGSEVLGNVNVGIALYTLLQMLLLVLIFSYGIKILHSYRVKWYWQLLGILYCVCFPFHHYIALSTTKDTIFSVFFLLFEIALAVLLKKGENSLKIGKTDILFAVSVVGIVLFRSNGKYAMLVFVGFGLLALAFGKKSKRLLGRIFTVATVGLVIGQLILTGVFRFTGAEQGDKREMLSMPIQQLARCMIYHGGVGVLEEDDNTMEDVDKALINDFLLNESYKNYRGSLADPVKRHTNTYVVRYRTVEFAKTYLGLLTQYPGEFINAALAVDAGYLYPKDVSHAYVYAFQEREGEGYVQVNWYDELLNEWGIYKDSKWESLYDTMWEWADENAYLKLPILRYLFMPGSYLWLYLLLAGYLLISKRFRLLLPLALVLGYFATLLLGPTVQLRYIYPLMITLPFYALLSCQTGKDSIENDR